MNWKTYVIIGSVWLGLSLLSIQIVDPAVAPIQFGLTLAIWFGVPALLIGYGLRARSKQVKKALA